MIGAGPSEQAKPLSTQEVKEVTDTTGQNKTSVKVSCPSGEKVEVDAKESAESLESGRRSWIILSASGETPELCAFRPKANDKSGLIDIEVTVRKSAERRHRQMVATRPGCHHVGPFDLDGVIQEVIV